MSYNTSSRRRRAIPVPRELRMAPEPDFGEFRYQISPRILKNFTQFQLFDKHQGRPGRLSTRDCPKSFPSARSTHLSNNSHGQISPRRDNLSPYPGIHQCGHQHLRRYIKHP